MRGNKKRKRTFSELIYVLFTFMKKLKDVREEKRLCMRVKGFITYFTFH
jgi:hypothetical protein